MMFQFLERRSSEMRLLKDLLEQAERYALAAGEQAPGAAHILAAACDLADGSARRAFERAGADTERYKAALKERHSMALRHSGLPDAMAALADDGPPGRRRPIFDAAPSGQAVVRQLAATRSQRRGRGLSAADVVAVIAGAPDSLVLRLFQSAGIDAAALQSAATLEAAGAGQSEPAAHGVVGGP